MRGRAFWALFSGCGVLCVSIAAQAQCSKDTDCKGDRVCEAGKCTSPTMPVPPVAAPGTEAAPAPAVAPPAEVAQPDSTQPVAPATTPIAPTNGATSPPAAGLQAPIGPLRPPLDAAAPPGAVTLLGKDEPETRRRSRVAMVSGIVMVSIGPIALLGALAAANSQSSCDDALSRDYPDHRLPTSERYRVDACNAYSVPLYLFGIGGAVLSVAGIPLIIYGAKNVPAQPKSGSVQVLPWASREAGGLRLRLDL